MRRCVYRGRPLSGRERSHALRRPASSPSGHAVARQHSLSLHANYIPRSAPSTPTRSTALHAGIDWVTRPLLSPCRRLG
jgi:hypothetical protein